VGAVRRHVEIRDTPALAVTAGRPQTTPLAHRPPV
jgi:hypothetical protein